MTVADFPSVEADSVAEALALSRPGLGAVVFRFPWGGWLLSADAAALRRVRGNGKDPHDPSKQR